ncbi:MAG: hypothetical protein M1834_003473 [Cirrosporium novae-zelandiae]|nr:MAG: hypothetical protein M1834_003473 [Cirrosporium novae-zelandiae]
MLSSLTLLLFPFLASAHFKLDFPTSRGFDEDLLVNGPCGSQNTPSSNRTLIALTSSGSASFPIQLTMGHDEAEVQVNLALGNNAVAASRFNINLVKTFEEEGLGAFCMKDIEIPSSLNITDGTNATLQVITNGDPNGGLYNCADLTFTTATASAATYTSCKNNTGVTATPISGAVVNANGSSSSGSSSTSAASGTAASSSSTGTSAANTLVVAGWGSLLGALGVVVAAL